MNQMEARCRPGQKTGCVAPEEFFRVAALAYLLYAALYARQQRR